MFIDEYDEFQVDVNPPDEYVDAWCEYQEYAEGGDDG